MKALKLRVDWMFGWMNSARIQLLVDRLPPYQDLRWHNYPLHTNHTDENKNGHGLYLARHGGYVNMLSYRGPSEGYGGRHFHLQMDDGTERTLIGPWSGNSGFCNSYYSAPGEEYGHITECRITEETHVWKEGFTFYSGHVEVPWLREAMATLRPDLQLVEEWVEMESQMSGEQRAVVHHGTPTRPATVEYAVAPLIGTSPSFDEAEANGDRPFKSMTGNARDLYLLGAASMDDVREYEAYAKIRRAEWEKGHLKIWPSPERLAQLKQGERPTWEESKLWAFPMISMKEIESWQKEFAQSKGWTPRRVGNPSVNLDGRIS